VAAGEGLGVCGRSGLQPWAHLHLELRWRGFEEVWLGFWGGRLGVAELSRLYADPFTLFRLASGWNAVSDGAAAPAKDVSVLAALQADRDYNYGLKMAFEGRLRDLEGRRRLKRGTTDRLVASVPR